MRDYTKIEAWRLADDLTVAVYERTRSFPKEEIYGLTSNCAGLLILFRPTSSRELRERVKRITSISFTLRVALCRRLNILSTSRNDSIICHQKRLMRCRNKQS